MERASPTMPTLKIVVVEDDETVRQFIKDVPGKPTAPPGGWRGRQRHGHGPDRCWGWSPTWSCSTSICRI